MKRLLPLLLLIVVLGIFLFKNWKSKTSEIANETPSESATKIAAPSNTSAIKVSEYVTPAGSVAFEDLGVRINSNWKKSPALNNENFLKFEVLDVATGNPVPSPGVLSVSAWSKNFGYGIVQPIVTPVLDKDGKTLTGVYHAARIFFLAPDQWEVRIYLKRPDGKELTQNLMVDLGTPPPNPMTDPNSPTYIMMKGMGMDHTANHNAAKDIVDEKKERIHAATSKALKNTEEPANAADDDKAKK